MKNYKAAGMEVSDSDLEKLRNKCIKDIKKMNGSYSFENALKYQQGKID